MVRNSRQKWPRGFTATSEDHDFMPQLIIFDQYKANAATSNHTPGHVFDLLSPLLEASVGHFLKLYY